MTESYKILIQRKKRLAALLAVWFEANRRSLPWRTERSLYRTVVSEFMLQQTQVATVLPYFARWVRELPDFDALARAGEGRVSKLWEGLGYYRRARLLHALAKALVALPEPPRKAAGWRELPGVGPYTAAAVASLMFDDPAACVDGNVVRILARLTGETKSFASGSEAVRHFQPMAEALLDEGNPGRHNEAMMELGATVCLRRKPRCESCPLAKLCAARRSGAADLLPKIRRPPTIRQKVRRIWAVRDGALLLHRAPSHSARLSGLLELPRAEDAGVATGNLPPSALIGCYGRTITRHAIKEFIFRVDPADLPETGLGQGLEWIPIEELDSKSLSGPHRRWIRGLLADAAPRPAGQPPPADQPSFFSR